MILSASRRTDIPAFYTEWFMDKIRKGELLIRNPLFYHQVSQVELNSELVECIIFWTRNPKPLMPYLKELDDLRYKYYFQYTVTGYPQQWETNNPPLEQKIETFQQLSEHIGKEKVIWRYDPIFLDNKDLSVEFHLQTFEKLVSKLYPHTNRCVISFLDTYKKIEKKIHEYQIYSPLDNKQELHELLVGINQIVKPYNILIETCSEDIQLLDYNIKQGKCIDDTLIEQITGKRFKKAKKDSNQRACCGCITSIDIGDYNTCLHGCQYCYATYNTEQTKNNFQQHNSQSLLLSGDVLEKDNISLREMKILLGEDVTNSLF